MNDGDTWQPLTLNMPPISIRDLIVKDDDVAVGTHGRGFWILDNVTSLRQWNGASARSAATLFKPATATRVRYSMYTDTPIPPDEPRAENPPDGAMIDYYLPADAQVVMIDIVDTRGRVIRTYRSDDPTPAPADAGNVPWYWFRPAAAPSRKAGLQRFVWDLHYARPTTECSLPISATPFNTKCEPEGPWVMPGVYTARLTVDGAVVTQTFRVRMDPRVTTPLVALRQQHDLSVALYDAMRDGAPLAVAARQRGDAALAAEIERAAASHSSVIEALQDADGVPTDSAVRAANERLTVWRALLQRAAGGR
jgi:hypothetical protein